MSVCAVISSYRNDEAVISLLESFVDSLGPIAEVLVVDSEGTGAVPRAIEARGWGDRVQYETFDTNAGAAGNVARRLAWAAERGHDWAFAVNHDGSVDPDVVAALLAQGERMVRAGAVYPLRYKVGRGKYDLTGRSALPLPFQGTSERPRERLIDVYWNSSNGALYSLAPAREGLLPWQELWHGWEDLGYGWLLHQHGYRQVILTEVEMDDPYEYAQRTLLTVSDKPSWMAYYWMRNLILASRWTDQPPLTWATLAGRLGLEVGLTLTLRPDKRHRLQYLAHGVVDGMRGRGGKWIVP